MKVTQKRISNTIFIKNGLEVVRSDTLATMFKKQHKHILEKVRATITEAEFSTSDIKKYFIEEKGNKPQGGSYTRFYLTRKGFDLIALSLTGKDALKYKIWYIDSFHEKQAVLEKHHLACESNSKDDLWVEFRKEGVEFRNKLTASISEHITSYRNEVEQKMNDGRYFENYTKMIYNSLGIQTLKGIPVRDSLNKRMLVRLEDIENRVADLIAKYAKQDIYYKDVFQIIKKQIAKQDN